jgi:DNA gyrase subunit A
MKNTIKADLLTIKEKYAIPRRTQIKDEEAIVLAKEELVEQDYVLLMDRFGYIKLVDIPTYERHKDSISTDYKKSINIKNTDKLLLFTETGAMHSIKALDIPLGKYKDKGVPIDNLSNYNSSKENIIFICASNDIKDKMLLFVNNKGLAKKVEGSNFIVSKKTVDATKLIDDEKLLFVQDLNDEEEIILTSKVGMFIRFKIEEIPQKGKTASGVRCIKLKDNDLLTNVYIGNNKESFIHQENTIEFTRIKLSKRDGAGTKIRI